MVYNDHMVTDDLYLKQAMKFLGIKSPITMRKYADSGELPSRKVQSKSGALWRVFNKKDLVAFRSRMVKDPLNGMSYLPPGDSPNTSPGARSRKKSR